MPAIPYVSSVVNTATIENIGTAVCTDVLKRPDLQGVAENAALEFYVTLCNKIPFDQLMVTSAEVPMVAGQAEYDLSNLVPALVSIASIRATFSTGNRRRLRRSHQRVYDSLSFQQSRRPATYARWGYIISMNPPPDSSSYTFRVHYWGMPPIFPVPKQTVLQIPQEWNELMKWETLYRVYYLLGEIQKATSLIMPAALPRQAAPKKLQMFEVGIIPRLWNDLLTTISQKENVDEDFSINPVIRAYSYRGK